MPDGADRLLGPHSRPHPLLEANYRLLKGDPQGALKALERTTAVRPSYEGPGAYRGDPMNALLLALAHRRLGHTAEAGAWLTTAQTAVRRIFPPITRPGTDPEVLAISFWRRTYLELLLQRVQEEQRSLAPRPRSL